MAIDIVTTTAATGPGSLAETLAIATTGDIIEFAAGLAGATIELAAELDIVRNVTIAGDVGGQRITLDGGGNFTDIKIEAGVTASLDGLDIVGGSGQGAAGSYGGYSGRNAGGGIYNAGTLTISDSTFSGDTATGGHGGAGSLYGGGGAGGSAAGGIYNAGGSLLLVDTSSVFFTANNATGGQGGAGGLGFLYGGGTGGSGGKQSSGGAASAPAPGGVRGTYGGAGGASGQAGGGGKQYWYGASGGGGGGGGGFAFADYGGRGTVIDLVTTTAASGPGSLADALAHAANGATIEFASDLAGDTIDLVATLGIVRNVSIVGDAGGQHITLDGGGNITDISVAAGVSASLAGLDIVGGSGQGAAGSYGGYSGGSAGGGIDNAGTLTVTDTTFSGDTATGGRGGNGDYYSPNGGAGRNAAGGIFNTGTLTIIDSTFSGDTATGGDGGSGWNYSGGGASGNAAGGIYNASGSLLLIDTSSRVSFIANSATGGQGGSGGPGGYGDNGGAGGVGGTESSGGAAWAPASGGFGQGYYGGAGGAPGQAGGGGKSYGYESWFVGPGGGGGGGFALADYCGPGTVKTTTGVDIVTTTAASGPGSLADTLANAANGATIEFASDLAGATIDLAAGLDIVRNVSIIGDAGGQRITLDGGGKVTDIKVEAGVTASLEGLDIVGGSGQGAAGSYGGAPGGGAGGGICNAGTLTISDSTFSGDTATGGQGGSGRFNGSGGSGSGSGGGAGGDAAGGIYNASGSLLLIDTSSGVAFAANSATGGQGGSGGPSERSWDYGLFHNFYAGGAGGVGGTESSGGAASAPAFGGGGQGGLAGAGGAPGGAGGYGLGGYGPGGGGGGGFTFADYGGQGTVRTTAGIDIVTTTAASGAGSLADTLANANNGDTIEFAAGLAGDTIELATELDIVRNVSIVGDVGGQRITLDGGENVTDIKVEAGVTASINGLDIVGGSGQGAAGGYTKPGGGAGGGIYNAGTLTITNSIFSGDTATGGMGGSGNYRSYGGGPGGNAAGAIYDASGSVLNIDPTRTSFIGNSASGGQGGTGGRGYLYVGGYGGAGESNVGAATAPAYGGDNGQGTYGGGGGAPGQPGGYGQSYYVYGHRYTGPGGGGGGGGGGGSAFADLGGLGTVTTEDLPCFRRGTRILTTTGKVAVEALRPGDLLPTMLGQKPAAVHWIGHRLVDCARHPTPEAVWPVRVAAHAFAPGQPARDLWLSPDHSVYLPEDGGVLVPVRYLVNGATIAQQPTPRVMYFHVELDRHDVLLAEGLPAESYLDTGNRGAFVNAGEPIVAHPDFALAIWQTEACARLTVDGPTVVAARQRLLDRAAALGWTSTADPALYVLAGTQALEAVPDGKGFWFTLPEDTAALRLLSRSMVPAHLFAEAIDTRELGLAVTSVALDGMVLALDDPRFAAGWHVPELGLRWTNGAAVLHCVGASLLYLQLAALPQFWVAPKMTDNEMEKVSQACASMADAGTARGPPGRRANTLY